MKRFFMVVLVVVFALSGCSLVSNLAKEMSKQETLIKAGTARYLYEHPDRAAQAEQLATRVLELVDAKVLVSTVDVKSYVWSKINSVDMLPEERELLAGILDSVQKELEQGTPVVSDKPAAELSAEMVNVREALIWLRDAAHRYKK